MDIFVLKLIQSHKKHRAYSYSEPKTMYRILNYNISLNIINKNEV